ncbi:MAG: LemA family protein [Acidobacteriota bacterium]|nr:MAG: LemA family protein [Acidobacteriota bacterium]
MLTIVGLVLLLVLSAAVVLIYNSLVKLRILTTNAWSDIGVQLKRRHDLIPNLVNTVKGYAAHERQTLESVVEARSRALTATGPGQQVQLEGELGRALKSLLALAENYPELRASENFKELQSQLAEIEEALQNARRYYNATVRDLNTKIQQFPSNILAGIFGFEEKEFFEVEEAERAVPKVQFE